MMGHFEFSDLTDVDLVRLHLSYGKQNAIKQPALAAACAISVRAVQEALEAMKQAGVPVITSSGKPAGVWLSNDPAELMDAYRRDRARAVQQLVNNRGRLKAIRALQPKQIELWTEAA